MSSRCGPYIEDICAPVARLADYTVTEDGRVIGRIHEDDEHLDHEDGPRVFEHTCKLGLEGIVSKRRTLVLNVDGDFGWSEDAEIDKIVRDLAVVHPMPEIAVALAPRWARREEWVTRARLSFAPPPCRMPLGQSQCIPQADFGRYD